MAWIGARLRERSAIVAGALLVALLGGCTTSRLTDPPKTATELYLLSTAIDHAVQPLSAEQMRGRVVFVDRTLTPEKEQDYLIASVRAKLMTGGARLTTVREQAEIIVEVRTPGVGIDRTELLVGIPGIPIGSVATMAGMPAANISTPELALVKNLTQWGTAGVAFVAYWRETGELVAASGPHIGRSYREDWMFFGVSRTLSNIPSTRPPDIEADLQHVEPLPAEQTGTAPPPQRERDELASPPSSPESPEEEPSP